MLSTIGWFGLRKGEIFSESKTFNPNKVFHLIASNAMECKTLRGTRILN